MKNNIIDLNFNMYSDANGGDPDSKSPTLKNYHKILWSKILPNGKKFELFDNDRKKYLYHNSELGEFILGSDAITNSYKNHKKKQWLIKQVPVEVNQLFETGGTIASYTLFPKNRINGKHTINQARGVNRFIDDRFDLTLECIRLFYQGIESPLFETLNRYKLFFELFENFNGYINFFLLNDLLDENQNIKFYLPFDNFKTPPKFSNKEEYLEYRKKVLDFVKSRKKRIEGYINNEYPEHNNA